MYEDLSLLHINVCVLSSFLLAPSQASVTSPVETTAGARARTSVRSVSAQFYLSCFPLLPRMIPSSDSRALMLTATSALLLLLVCHSDKDGVRSAV